MIQTLKLKLLNRLTSIKLIKTNRKSVSIEIDDNGEVLVKAPHLLHDNKILQFIKEKEQWIHSRISTITKGKDSFPIIYGSKVPYLGEELYLTKGVHKKGVLRDGDHLKLPFDCKDIKGELKKWFKDMAKVKLTKLATGYARSLKVKINKIYIKEQKTRWGSCSGKNNLNFNWKIVLTRPNLIEYLVIHEVCHLVHMNHSREFWDLVGLFDKDHKKHRKELEEAGYYLLSFLK